MGKPLLPFVQLPMVLLPGQAPEGPIPQEEGGPKSVVFAIRTRTGTNFSPRARAVRVTRPPPLRSPPVGPPAGPGPSRKGRRGGGRVRQDQD